MCVSVYMNMVMATATLVGLDGPRRIPTVGSENQQGWTNRNNVFLHFTSMHISTTLQKTYNLPETLYVLLDI